MGWVPERAWLTYLRLDVAAGDLDYDLATDVDGGEPRMVDTGLTRIDQPDRLDTVGDAGIPDRPWAWQATVLIVLAIALVLACSWFLTRPPRPAVTR
jgi:hypothetical protein